jgi:2-oxoglutarate dehydrogenase E1 component
MSSQYEFHGPNVGYILERYEQYLQSPDSVDPATREFFSHWTPPSTNGHGNGTAALVAAAPGVDSQKIVGLVSYVQAIRQYGHVEAAIDPLGRPRPGDPELSLEVHGISIDDLHSLPASLIDSPLAAGASNALEVIERLRGVYMSSIGFDNDHIRIPEEREWLREAAESRRYAYEGTDEQSVGLLKRLTQIETFEHFLQQSFPTKYRFSVEGLDMMVPMLDEVVEHTKSTNTATIAIGMAHRGRLNILAHIMKKPYSKILADFKDPLKLQEMREAIGWTVGDVKYHKGVRHEAGGDLTVTMPPNPSHLEQINPVAVGMSRAAGTDADQPGEPYFDSKKTLQILIHGDAAFPGQGIVSETLNLSHLPGYWTGGTIHIIANNQIGFTTLPDDGRSTLYASDLAKGFKVPVIHVNADDPAACIEVARIAHAYQERFERDILIDLIGYRRYGHNELDEPSFTQPMMYQIVREHKTVRQQWAKNLLESGVITEDAADQFVDEQRAELQAALDKVEQSPEELAEPVPEEPPQGAARKIKTAVSAERLHAINDGLASTLEGFNFYSRRMENTIRKRRDALDNPDENTIDWATAEELAFATILEDGIPIRMTGQDCERGTFSHRHAMLHDAETGDKLAPLQQFPQANAGFEIHNSPLSEAAVVGFEYGYNVQAPGRLVLWEAQYGDFINGAQTIVDEFLLSAREKWGQTPSLVMLLPHGHEGAGPDHSSGRPERFLQMAANTNLRLANVTTAAQYFHLLRRQALLLETDPLPLIIMTPKSLLRNPQVASSMNDLTGNKFQPVYDDPDADPEKVDRLVFCSGKFYLDLVNSEYREQNAQVALIRMEQLYPFPVADLKDIIKRYPNVEQIVWAQEEPKNMGAWEFMGYRLKKLVGIDTPVNYVGRRRSSSPAEGSSTAHQVNQSMIIEYAFTWKFD